MTEPDAAPPVAAGRRRNRGLAAVGVVAVIAAATALATSGVGHPGVGRPAAPPPFAPPGAPVLTVCTVDRVPPPSSDSPGVTAVDPTLRYAVGYVQHLGRDGVVTTKTVIWDNGVAHPVPPPDSVHRGVQLAAVNSRGWAVGAATASIGGIANDRPMVYRDGRSSLLPVPDGFQGGQAFGINAGGDIVGVATDPKDVALLWPADHPHTVVTLPGTPSVEGPLAHSISDVGVIGGWIGDDHGTLPYVWTDARTGHRLDLPDGATEGRVDEVRGDYAFGFVTGAAAVWNLRTGAVRVAPGRAASSIGDVDQDGAYVVNQTQSDGWRSFIVQPDGPTIAVPRPAGAGGFDPLVVAMSRDGHRLVGQLIGVDRSAGLTTWRCS